MAPLIDENDANRLRIAFARISRQLDKRAMQDGLTRTQLSVLSSVARAKQLPLAELAKIEGINPTMLSRILGKLEEQGFVKRVADETDRRAIRVAVTAAGSRAHERARKVRTQLLEQLLAQLGTEDLEVLHAALPALEAMAGVKQAVFTGDAGERQ